MKAIKGIPCSGSGPVWPGWLGYNRSAERNLRLVQRNLKVKGRVYYTSQNAGLRRRFRIICFVFSESLFEAVTWYRSGAKEKARWKWTAGEERVDPLNVLRTGIAQLVQCNACSGRLSKRRPLIGLLWLLLLPLFVFIFC